MYSGVRFHVVRRYITRYLCSAIKAPIYTGVHASIEYHEGTCFKPYDTMPIDSALRPWGNPNGAAERHENKEYES